MPKKDPAEAVRGMLSTQGARYRPSADAAPQRAIADGTDDAAPARPDPEVANDAPSVVTPVPSVVSIRRESGESAPSRRRPSGGRARKPAAPDGGEMQDNAPRTIRLSQRKANELRQAWFAARMAGEVLLSYQDFADRVVTRGLAQPDK